jgi:hypothetical protein
MSKKALWVPDKAARFLWAREGKQLPAVIACDVILVPRQGIRPRNILLRGPHGVLFTTIWRCVRFLP